MRLHAVVPPQRVTVNGVDAVFVPADDTVARRGANTWHYDGAEFALVLSLLQRFDVAADVRVAVQLPAGLQASSRDAMCNARGWVARALQLKPLLDATYSTLYPDDYSQVTWLSELGAILTYEPTQATFTEVIGAVRRLRTAALEQIQRMWTVDPLVRRNAEAMLKLT